MKFPTDERGITVPVLGLGRNNQVPIAPKVEEHGPFHATHDVILILCPTVDCRIAIGPDAKATEKSTRIPANMWLPVKIPPAHKLSIVWNGTDEGTLDITEAT